MKMKRVRVRVTMAHFVFQTNHEITTQYVTGARVQSKACIRLIQCLFAVLVSLSGNQQCSEDGGVGCRSQVISVSVKVKVKSQGHSRSDPALQPADGALAAVLHLPWGVGKDLKT